MSGSPMEDVEGLLRGAVNAHCGYGELGDYLDGIAGEVTRARISAHLRRCLICAKRLELMEEGLRAAEQREPLAAHASAALPSSEPWLIVWERLRAETGMSDEPWPFMWAKLQALPAEFVSGHAAGHETNARADEVASVKAYILRGGEQKVAAVTVTQRPRVSPDGRLVLGVTVAEHFFREDKAFGLTLALLPGGQLFETGLSLAPGEERLLVLELTSEPELRERLRNVSWESGEMPFQFLLHPTVRGPNGRSESEGCSEGFASGPAERRAGDVSIFFRAFARSVQTLLGIRGA